MITLAVLFVVCLVLSAFFSGAEMAFVSTSPFKLREMAEAGNRRAMKMVALREQPQSFLTAVLIGNNIVNAGATSIAAYIFQVYLGIPNEWLVTAVMAPILIIFGEMLPKDYGRLQQHHILLKFAGSLSLMTWLFRIPSFLIHKTIGALFGNLGNLRGKSIFVSEKEFRMLIEEGAQAGVLEHHEKQLIDRILDFEKLHVQSVMTPIDQVASVSITGTIRDVKDIARKTKSRI
ncbi:MAG: CNNM domain-containing protein, partial [Candidatus Omnitrophica bacterium]|nr:CNNM domain-containing protein [Candidatus Omnitrophota bacterium]